MTDAFQDAPTKTNFTDFSIKGFIIHASYYDKPFEKKLVLPEDERLADMKQFKNTAAWKKAKEKKVVPKVYFQCLGNHGMITEENNHLIFYGDNIIYKMLLQSMIVDGKEVKELIRKATAVEE